VRVFAHANDTTRWSLLTKSSKWKRMAKSILKKWIRQREREREKERERKGLKRGHVEVSRRKTTDGRI